MRSISDLDICDKDALMAWVFDTQEKLFDMKIQIQEGLPFDLSQLTQDTRREDAVGKE
jgi:hypothetical protein